MGTSDTRRLSNLENSGSTARILNLRNAHLKNPDRAELHSSPFFSNPVLNKCILLKHRVRQDERDLFVDRRKVTTKIIIPLDHNDLRIGAFSVMTGQKFFNTQTDARFGDSLQPGKRDRIVLDLLDQLPSLDPFLIREQLRRNEIEPDRAYFNISDADVHNMQVFVESEIAPLVNLANNGTQTNSIPIAKLATTLLSNNINVELGPLKEVLKLSDSEYSDGVFAWRGFLYFKWSYLAAEPAVYRLQNAIKATTPNSAPTPKARAYIESATERLIGALDQSRMTIYRLLGIYNKAFIALVKERSPMEFKEFLINAPNRFMEIGQPMGAINHMLSF